MTPEEIEQQFGMDEACPVGSLDEDGKWHCRCWYDGDGCCRCKAPAMTNEEKSAQGMEE